MSWQIIDNPTSRVFFLSQFHKSFLISTRLVIVMFFSPSGFVFWLLIMRIVVVKIGGFSRIALLFQFRWGQVRSSCDIQIYSILDIMFKIFLASGGSCFSCFCNLGRVL